MDRTQASLTLHDAIASADAERFTLTARSTHPADIATALAEFDTATVRTVLGWMPIQARADLFGYLDTDVQHVLAERLSRSELAELFGHMSSDERADLFKQLDETQRESFLPALAQAERDDIRRLARYEEGTAGALMTSEYATVGSELTAAEAIEHLRSVAPDAETIYQSHVIDQDRELVGTVSLKDLVISPPFWP